jgi:hypothetical protein
MERPISAGGSMMPHMPVFERTPSQRKVAGAAALGGDGGSGDTSTVPTAQTKSEAITLARAEMGRRAAVEAYETTQQKEVRTEVKRRDLTVCLRVSACVGVWLRVSARVCVCLLSMRQTEPFTHVRPIVSSARLPHLPCQHLDRMDTLKETKVSGGSTSVMMITTM